MRQPLSHLYDDAVRCSVGAQLPGGGSPTTGDAGSDSSFGATTSNGIQPATGGLAGNVARAERRQVARESISNVKPFESSCMSETENESRSSGGPSTRTNELS